MACLGIQAQAQFNVPIGTWHTHLPYSAAISVADAGDKIYCANPLSLFSYDKTDNSYERLSTATGFSDVGIRGIYYDIPAKTLLVAYTNSNLDFVFDNEMYNYPLLKTSTINGDKNIYHAAFDGDTCWLSCGFGMVLFDIKKRESPATCFFTDTDGSNMKVNASAVFQDSIYAATNKGLFRCALSEPNIQDFSRWSDFGDAIPDSIARFVIQFNNHLYADVDSVLYEYSDGEWMPYFYETGWTTQHISADDQAMVITQRFGPNNPSDSTRILVVATDGSLTEIVNDVDLLYVVETVRDADGDIWIADNYKTLVKYNGTNFTSYFPNGPLSNKVLDMATANNVLYVAPGEINASWNYQYNSDGFFVYDYGFWGTSNRYNYPALDSVFDIMTIAANPKTNTIWMGSFGGGLLKYERSDFSLQIYKQGYIENVPGDPTSYRVSGLALDTLDNLWISNFGATNPLAVRKADGTFKHFNPGLPTDILNQVGQIAIDEFNTKWVQLPRGNGILVYNEMGTIDDESDDLIKVLGAGAGNGNLHTNFVNCIAVDKQNEIWVGTSEGITIFYNPGEVYTNTTAGDATQPLVNLGGYYEQLLRNDIVNTIAVDGANRKWVGTNSGAFLISADGTEQLLYFNADNSPLISNTILNIEIDGNTGDVYFGTDKGIIAYRYTATEGVDEISDVKVFPNPVRPDYDGNIAINGLTQDAEVRITDMAGRTVWQTVALGGQAIWNGRGYDGNRAHTGVYLVYSTNADGSETAVAKIMLLSAE